MRFFTSDHHFYHRNIISFCKRPYKTVEEMNEDMIIKWNSVVDREDTLYHLGDFSMAARPVELYTSRLNGHLKLIPGNHDFCHSVHKKSRVKETQNKWIEFYEHCGWEVLPEQYAIEIARQKVVLCHLPYAGDHTEDVRYPEHRPKDEGGWLLHGHVHTSWKTRGKQINVGVDQWNMFPVSEAEIARIVSV